MYLIRLPECVFAYAIDSEVIRVQRRTAVIRTATAKRHKFEKRDAHEG
jgi:hypothetical protein